MVVLLGPHQVHGSNARTEAEYRLFQRAILRRNGRGDPWVYLGPPPLMFVSGGKCVIDCPNCGNGPVVDVSRRLALCCECGAVCEGVGVPAAEDLETLTAIMANRPQAARNSRHADDQRPATLSELDVENVERGLPPVLDDTEAIVAARRAAVADAADAQHIRERR